MGENPHGEHCLGSASTQAAERPGVASYQIGCLVRFPRDFGLWGQLGSKVLYFPGFIDHVWTLRRWERCW
jgi:hypothetical protein